MVDESSWINFTSDVDNFRENYDYLLDMIETETEEEDSTKSIK